MANKHIRIFVEGDEAKFMEDYISFLFENEPPGIYDIKIVGGWTRLHLVKNLLKEVSDNGGSNLVIFDANADPEKRRSQLAYKQQKLALDFQTFLLPNNRDKGNFETLLERIANATHKPIFQCFDDYQKCIVQKEPSYNPPDQKARIFAYLKALREEAKPKYRNYTLTKCWDLASTELNPLKEFLIRHFQE